MPESSDQSVFPMTDYIKLELLSERTKANEFLKKFRRLQDDNTFDSSRKETFFIDFVGEVINLYSDLRDAIFAWDEKSKTFKKDEIKKLKEIDKEVMNPTYKLKNKKGESKYNLIWLERFQLLNKFLYTQGLTRLAFDRELSDVDGIGRR